MRITSSNDKLNILLIEDSKGDAMLIEKHINTALPGSHDIIRTTSLVGALHTLAEQNFDVALLDRSLPDVEGFSGLQTLQNISPVLPIIFLTAYKDEETAFEAIEQGAQDYLFKDTMDGHTIKRAIQYAILRKEFEGVLITRANYDLLTGLANRTLFESRLEMAMAKIKRQPGNIALLFMDLDKFKHINDTYGHQTGDQLLKEIGVRIRNSLRPYDTAARFGGDEFAILLEDITNLESTEVVAKKLIQIITSPYVINGETINTGISIGISIHHSTQSQSFESFMQKADEAMYTAKKTPESTYAVHSTDKKTHHNPALERSRHA